MPGTNIEKLPGVPSRSMCPVTLMAPKGETLAISTVTDDGCWTDLTDGFNTSVDLPGAWLGATNIGVCVSSLDSTSKTVETLAPEPLAMWSEHQCRHTSCSLSTSVSSSDSAKETLPSPHRLTAMMTLTAHHPSS